MLDPESHAYMNMANLEASWLGLEDPGEAAMATVIAEETERQRELFREEFPDVAYEVPGNPDLVQVFGYADTMSWEVLLTFGDCVYRCAKRTQSTPEVVADFARRRCRPSQPWTLFWFEQAITQARGSSARQEEIAAAATAEAEEQQREVAQQAGVKSGQARRKKSRIPEAPVLLKDRDYLMQSGMARRDVVRKLAERYRMSTDMVRLRLNEAEEQERTGSGPE